LSRELIEVLGESGQDNLIAGPRFPVAFKGVSLKAGNGLVRRGTVLAILLDGTAAIVDSSRTAIVAEAPVPNGASPDCVLAEDVDTGQDAGAGGIPAVAYSAGYFVRGALTFGGDDTYATHELDMRKLNMHLSSSIDKEGGIH
jgi:hypothetical protein